MRKYVQLTLFELEAPGAQEGNTYVRCAVCKWTGDSLSGHLGRAHQGMTKKQYMAKYPGMEYDSRRYLAAKKAGEEAHRARVLANAAAEVEMPPWIASIDNPEFKRAYIYMVKHGMDPTSLETKDTVAILRLMITYNMSQGKDASKLIELHADMVDRERAIEREPKPQLMLVDTDIIAYLFSEWWDVLMGWSARYMARQPPQTRADIADLQDKMRVVWFKFIRRELEPLYKQGPEKQLERFAYIVAEVARRRGTPVPKPYVKAIEADAPFDPEKFREQLTVKGPMIPVDAGAVQPRDPNENVAAYYGDAKE